MSSNSTVRVWVRTLGNSCRVRLESQEHGQWLLDRLKERNALECLGPVEIHATETGCRLLISNSDRKTLETLETALREISGVELMLSPEESASRDT